MGQSESYIAHPLPPLEDDSIFLKKEWTDVVAYLETFHRNGVKPVSHFVIPDCPEYAELVLASEDLSMAMGDGSGS